ncbi:unnamed protein product [Cylindrotheca closterium]|uniref:Fe2OG dioxygenase domain-containing protein n=1 Tax=Cylindrotheca closterium TaxID=2856 RepID=A0AAD2FRK0_9STRA|nr:unnamed protein product [Cylindrotheca closterium]
MFLLPYALVILLYGGAAVVRTILKRRPSVVNPRIASYDSNDKDTIDTSSSSSLAQVRLLQAPEVTSTRGGELEHLEFWNTHSRLIQLAWHEWEREMIRRQNSEQIQGNETYLPSLDEDTMMEPTLKERIQQIWKKPSLEAELELQAAIWEEPIRNVHTCSSFFSPQGIQNLRHHLSLMGQANIPTRRPNGMNRNGFVLDDETEGGVSYVSVNDFRGWLVDDYLRPLGRMFFPEYIGSDEDDESSYAFTVHYQYNDGRGDNVESTNTSATKRPDVKLKEHSDASVVTVNINLNLPGEDEYGGSQLLFLDDNDDDGPGTNSTEQRRKQLEFQPGMAVIHRGLHRHQALPIEKGERHQLIIWLFGNDGYVRVAPYKPKEQLSVKKRWSKSKNTGGSNHMRSLGGGNDLNPFEL